MQISELSVLILEISYCGFLQRNSVYFHNATKESRNLKRFREQNLQIPMSGFLSFFFFPFFLLHVSKILLNDIFYPTVLRDYSCYSTSLWMRRTFHFFLILEPLFREKHFINTYHQILEMKCNNSHQRDESRNEGDWTKVIGILTEEGKGEGEGVVLLKCLYLNPRALPSVCFSSSSHWEGKRDPNCWLLG